MSSYRSGPSPILVVVIGACVVLGGYFVWRGLLDFVASRGNITAEVTQQAVATATARAQSPILRPTLYVPATFTPLPPCQWFRVKVERAVYRECPSTDNEQCPIRDVVPEGTELCVYGRVPDVPEWYVVELNPGGAYRDTVYMHESVLEAVNPTPTPTVTMTPLPTVTPTPSPSPQPTLPPSPSPTYDPRLSPTPTPSVTPSPTPPQVEL